MLSAPRAVARTRRCRYNLRLRLALLALIPLAAMAGPVEFGNAELARAFTGRGLNPRAFRIKTEVAADPPESYRIAPGLISGGDLRGLMYGLLEAAEQIRAAGRLRKAAAAPVLAIRGVRMLVKDADAPWFQSSEYWQTLFGSMARNRFNRFHLALPKLADDTGALRAIAKAAGEHGVDLVLGLWGALDGQPAAEMQAALGRLLSSCPSIRSVQVRAEPEAVLCAVRALQDTGRRMVLEVPAAGDGVMDSAANSGVPVRIARTYPGEAADEPRPPYFWEIVDARAPERILRRLAATRASGFELDLAAGPEGAAAIASLAWGRLGYDPQSK